MSDHEYPIPCLSPSCGKFLYGPVKYCPYCGILIEADPTQVLKDPPPPSPNKHPSAEAVLTPPPPIPTAVTFESTEVKKDSVTTISSEHKEKVEVIPEEKTPRLNPYPILGYWKWIGITIILVVCLVSYLMTTGKPGRGRTTGEVGQEEISVKPDNGGGTHGTSQRDAALSLTIEALRQGTDLSATISKLPKLEKVLQAAKKLQEITPRYQEQVTTAENSLQASQAKKDKCFMAYFDRVLQLGKYSPGQIEYAFSSIKHGDPTPREVVVLDLLRKHLRLLHDNSKVDPAKLISDFDNSFMSFID